MRQRILQVFLVLDGLFFLCAVYPIAMNLWNQGAAGETMMLSIYFALGVFLLLAVRAPAEHRSLIAFAGWGNVAHGFVMSLMAIKMIPGREELLGATVLCLVVGLPLLICLPRQSAGPQKSIESGRSMHAHAG